MQAILWLVLLVGFLLAESATVALVSIWFAAGALAALITSFFTSVFWVPAVVFLVVSCALLAMLRPLVRKFITPKITKTNVDSVIGSQGYVTEDIDNIRSVGQVKLGGMYWSARSENGDPIPVGTLVQVSRIEGVKVFVSVVKAKQTANP